MNVGMSQGLSNHLSEEDKSYSSNLFWSGPHGGSRRTKLDPNVANEIPLNFEHTFPHLIDHDNSMFMEMSECESTTNSTEEKDHISVFKMMKQNNFTSKTYNRLPPPVPKQRGRKTKSQMMQKKLEMAKKERVDRFARISAPSGLFKELNPGIINHVRNSKQVYSIIEALVKSECIKTGNVSIKLDTKMKEQPCQNHGNLVSLECSSERNGHVKGSSVASFKKECFDTCSSQNDNSNMAYKCSRFIHGGTNDKSSFKMSSLVDNGTEGVTSLSSDDNVSGVSVLTVKAATVASRWLELLYQDAKGRLTALCGSRKRARCVIQTDLPFLFAKEFSSTMSDDASTLVSKVPKNNVADLHQTRWSSLFTQMEMALSEEEKQLEGWISQVKEMQLHCERGLRNVPQIQMSRTRVDSLRTESIGNEKDFGVTAVAASLYSTCRFLLNKDEGNW